MLAALKHPGRQVSVFLKNNNKKKKAEGGMGESRAGHIPLLKNYVSLVKNSNQLHQRYPFDPSQKHTCFWNAFKVISSKRSSQQAVRTRGPPALKLAPQPTAGSGSPEEEDEDKDEPAEASATARGSSNAPHTARSPSFLPVFLSRCFVPCIKQRGNCNHAYTKRAEA